ncbi:MAG TPA: SGNH/GDSL hydrolase family protein [Chloroflexi bacterium]|nr:SGNH/GDSL hydrolase family protein [Chloroflexota bacterium]
MTENTADTSETLDLRKPLLEIRLSRGLVFSVMALVLILLALEGLARGLIFLKRRLIDPQIITQCDNPYSDLCPYAREWDNEMGRAQRYDVLFGTSWTPGFRGEWITINSLGFRGEEIAPQKPAGTVRLIMVGGSAVAGAGVHDDESIPAYLEALLQEEMGCPAEVINAGTPGYTSTQELVLFQFRLLPLDPDIVIVFDGRNDVYFATSPRWDPLYSPPLQHANAILHGENRAPLPERVWNWLTAHSVLASTLNQIVIRLRGIEAGMTPAQRAQLTMHREVLDVYARNLRLIGVLGQAHDVPVVFVVQPVLGAGDKPLSDEEEQILDIRRGHGYMDLMLETYPDLAQTALAVGDEMGIPAFDYSRVFDNVRETVYSDDVHLTARGNEIVAQRLMEDLRPLLAEVGCSP